MKGFRFGAVRLQDRLVFFFAALLMAVLVVSFSLIGKAIEGTARSTLREELQVGSRVFQRLLEQNTQRLADATTVLTSDYGFREAVASRDRDTILSVLANHSARINASGMAVVGLDGKVVSDTLSPATADQPYAFPDLIQAAATVGRASAIRIPESRAYQIVVVPVLAPLPIAWVSMSFVMDDAVARDLQRLTSSEVTFLDTAGRSPRILASTLPASRRDALVDKAGIIVASGKDGLAVAIGNEDFEVLSMRLEHAGKIPVFAVLQRSVSDALEPYFILQVVLLFLAAISLGVTLFGAMWIARRITRPIANLAAAAREIERGNFRVDVTATGSVEIDELTRAFDGMTRGLAERDNMRDVLGKVASRAVANQLLTGEIALGGEERDATVLFTDIRNFTTLAEQLSPTQTLALLNEFLTTISAIVEKHDGVVDKYLGDGVMAIFGAPVKLENHAQHAIEAAIAIRDGVRALGVRLATQGMPHPDVGVGVNTSRVIAGNIGSPTRLNYTVLGDGVNLAARLEGLTKRYQVAIVVGERTRDSVMGIAFRELDKVRVRGRTQPVRVFEPLGRTEEIPEADVAHVAEWHAALDDFRERRWARARERCAAIAGIPGYTRLADLYLGYLAELEAQAPGDNWDGAFTLYEK